ncbi:hypothetical protein [Peredibacter starrii]|uniref:Uncharacterized protein n=1 Tax=Peredibacter starrii TaxID=28202 RepID=A0AAX4HRB9_9BACT|nr:hypothetical protein [Peredibacter starrii]WPU65626.1 hypothetical protein SOO65_02580 [Peredibacter starrii]
MTNQRILDVTLPLSPQNQIEYFKDKSILFRIDMANSRITPKQCFMTLSNMRIKAEIGNITPAVLEEYMTANFVIETTNLPQIIANIILGYKYQRMPYVDVESHFSLENYANFIVNHEEMIQQWCGLINSIPLYLIMSTNKIHSEDEIKQWKLDHPKVEGKIPNIGVNISQLLALPDFLSLFFDPTEMKTLLQHPYFPYYFDEYIYGGEKLINFLATEKHLSHFAYFSMGIMLQIKNGKIPMVETDDQKKPV